MENQKGQALIIVLLVMSIVLTVVLSSVSRSVTEIQTTTYEEDSLRAFSAAEAGIEDKLINPQIGVETIESVDPSDASIFYKAMTTAPSPDSKQYIYPNPLSSGESATFWLVSHDNSGLLSCNGFPCWEGGVMSVCYKPQGESQEPAVEITIYYDETNKSSAVPNNFADLTVYRKLFDFDNTRDNGGEDPGGTCNFGDIIFTRSASVNTVSEISPTCRDGCLILVKVRVLYASDQQIGLWLRSGGPTSFPAQRINISSTGVAGDSMRKVDVTRGFPEPPSLFDTAVFSLDGLEK